jgi:hypothetical protein
LAQVELAERLYQVLAMETQAMLVGTQLLEQTWRLMAAQVVGEAGRRGVINLLYPAAVRAAQFSRQVPAAEP